jgi:hypothetical protein
VCSLTADEGAQSAAAAAAAGQAAGGSQPYYMKQTIGNACGTIAMLHAIGNNKERAGIGRGSHRLHRPVGCGCALYSKAIAQYQCAAVLVDTRRHGTHHHPMYCMNLSVYVCQQ